MLTVEISQLYTLSPPPATDQKQPQPAADAQTPHAASESSPKDTSRRFRYTPRDATHSRLFPQDECPSSPTKKNDARQNPRFARRNAETSRLFPVDENQSPPPVKKQTPAAGAESPPPEAKQTSTDLNKSAEDGTVAAMPAGVKKSTSPTPLDPLKSHREANLLAAATPEQRRFHQLLRAAEQRVGVKTSTQPRQPVLQKRARQNNIKPKGKPAASIKPRIRVTASPHQKIFYTENDAQRDLETLGKAKKLLLVAIELNAARLPSEQLDQMVAIAMEIQSLMKTIKEVHPASKQEASKLRRDANTLSGHANSHLMQIRNTYVRETPPRPEVRKPLPETEVTKAQKIRHAIWREQFIAHQKLQREVEREKPKGHFFIEYPAMQHREKGTRENAIDGGFSSPHILYEYFEKADFGKAPQARHRSELDAGYSSQASSKSSPIGSPGDASPSSWLKWERQSSTSNGRSDNGSAILSKRPQKAGIYKAKQNVLRRLLKRIRSMSWKTPRKGRSLFSMVESPNVTLLSYSRKP